MPTIPELLEELIASNEFPEAEQTAMRDMLTVTEAMSVTQLVEYIRQHFELDLFTRVEGGDTLHLDAVGVPSFLWTPAPSMYATTSCPVDPVAFADGIPVLILQDLLPVLTRSQLIPLLIHWKAGLSL